MSKTTRRPQQLYAVIMWLLSVIFAGFLIGLGNLIIKDIPRADRSVTIEQFVDSQQLSSIETSISLLQSQMLGLNRDTEDARSNLKSAEADFLSAQSSLNNWLKTRTATESSAQNPEVLQRTQAVEALKQAERLALKRVEAAMAGAELSRRKKADLEQRRTDLKKVAQPKYAAAKRTQELRAFLLRLALTLPLLIIGGWLLARKRGSGYWPLYRGFVLFSLFAFFVELVPYLPSYGGYVRYGVGIILVIIAGHFIIRAMRLYLNRKQVEESRSEGERRQSIEYETALKKIAAKTCPGCDRSIIRREGVDTDFCVHCGIRLEEKCGNCDTRNVSFYRFCLSCGTPSDTPNNLADD